MLHWSDLTLSLVQPSISLLWKDEDGIPVHCLAWDHPNVSYVALHHPLAFILIYTHVPCSTLPVTQDGLLLAKER